MFIFSFLLIQTSQHAKSWLTFVYCNSMWTEQVHVDSIEPFFEPEDKPLMILTHGMYLIIHRAEQEFK